MRRSKFTVTASGQVYLEVYVQTDVGAIASTGEGVRAGEGAGVRDSPGP